MINIDKGVPCPEKAIFLRKYPFRDMKVGDSFIVPGTVKHPYQTTYWANARYKPAVFRAADTGNGVWRIWRIA